MSDTEDNEKWCHFLMDNKSLVDVPVSFIERYSDEMKLEKNKVSNLFWSENDSVTPESIISNGKGPIIYVNKLAKKPSAPVTGWYESTLLAVAGKYSESNIFVLSLIKKGGSLASGYIP